MLGKIPAVGNGRRVPLPVFKKKSRPEARPNCKKYGKKVAKDVRRLCLETALADATVVAVDHTARAEKQVVRVGANFGHRRPVGELQVTTDDGKDARKGNKGERVRVEADPGKVHGQLDAKVGHNVLKGLVGVGAPD